MKLKTFKKIYSFYTPGDTLRALDSQNTTWFRPFSLPKPLSVLPFDKQDKLTQICITTNGKPIGHGEFRKPLFMDHLPTALAQIKGQEQADHLQFDIGTQKLDTLTDEQAQPESSWGGLL